MEGINQAFCFMPEPDWIARIDQTTARFKAAFGEWDADRLNWKPAPQTWSVAQILDHLITINKTYFPVMEKLRKGEMKLPFLARQRFMVALSSRMVLKSVQPETKRKMNTFPIWEPSASQIPASIVSDFSLHQEEMKTLISGAMDLVEQKGLISSPANQFIVYTVGTAFEIIVTHEERHLAQAKGIIPLLAAVG